MRNDYKARVREVVALGEEQSRNGSARGKKAEMGKKDKGREREQVKEIVRRREEVVKGLEVDFWERRREWYTRVGEEGNPVSVD